MKPLPHPALTDNDAAHEAPGVAGLRWHATYVPPGTHDPEDTDTVIEPGWYVTGCDPEQPDGPVVQMLVEHTVFRTVSDEQPEQTAQAVAQALSGVDTTELRRELDRALERAQRAEHRLTLPPMTHPAGECGACDEARERNAVEKNGAVKP